MPKFLAGANLSPTQYTRCLLVILAAPLVLSATYKLATPPLEASDENKHYPVVQHIQANLELPVLVPEDPGLWLQEAAQPPLYYILMAAFTMPLGT